MAASMATVTDPSSPLELSSDPRGQNRDPEESSSGKGATSGEPTDAEAHGCGASVRRRAGSSHEVIGRADLEVGDELGCSPTARDTNMVFAWSFLGCCEIIFHDIFILLVLMDHHG
jgi:hypothetical protein